MPQARTLEPNTLVPKGVMRYAPSGFPERVVASPAQDASRGFAVAWRTDVTVGAPVLEWVVAGDSPDMGIPNSVVAATHALETENGTAHHHRVDVGGLQPDTLYAYRVQGDRTWSPWYQVRTAAEAGEAFEMLYFGDTQNKNASLTTRVMREAARHAPHARLALYAGDLVSGGDGEDDNEWGEWFDATDVISPSILTAPAPGNHEYFEEYEDTPQERRVLGKHWPVQFALPANGAPGVELTTYWFDFQGVRVAVIDGTSALDLGTAQAQARWLEGVLASNPNRWSMVVTHQPFYSPREGRDNVLLREHLLPVIGKHKVDLVLQGHDHTYGRRGPDDGAGTPVFTVSVVGAKQYRLSDEARATMKPVGEDTQLFQVIRVDGGRLRYEARTATGRLYDAFELIDEGKGGKRRIEIEPGRIDERFCAREQTLKGRKDRCWE
ncbi:metallophosphoesterase family protein [Lysobacter alkalisoli]|uniref:Metallophosphoesterase family protein n=2 Tax=Marilutibacter alkalisoli TaxID=2591633 RepID=A0A514BXJ5_9GAMM|nr:metallophosphoesterase family protein [Lysobacter alkalisoli]QDH71719.1 metallophosphoesterase family protein [Lysobacter alkalisoli]